MEFEAPSVWRIASKHTVTFHNLAALGLKRPPQSLSTSPRSMPRPQRALDAVSDTGAELKVRIQLPPAESQRTFGSSQDDGCFDGKEIMRSSNRRAGAAGGRQGQLRLTRRHANPAHRA